MKYLGIFREILHSPQREFDDYEILRLTGQRLSDAGLDVSLKKPEEVLAEQEQWNQSLPDVVFMMCEQEKILSVLQQWEQKGVTVVNSVRSVLNTYRYRMIPLLEKNQISMPKSRLVATSYSANGEYLNAKVWVKRGDVHNTQKGDVALTSGAPEINSLLNRLRERGITQAVVQDHVEGDLIKFYGIGPADKNSFWFQWFYHKDQNLNRYSFSESLLQEITRSAAQALGLEVFGGDVVVDRNGSVFLIDINAWPSFALFRKEASQAIAKHLTSSLEFRVES